MADGRRSWAQRFRIPALAGLLVVGLSLGSRSPHAQAPSVPAVAPLAVFMPTAPETGAISSPQPPQPVAQFAAAESHAAPPPPPAPKPVVSFDASDLLLMAQVIQGEAAGQPLNARLGVAAVIINRVRFRGFASTIRGVIDSPGQFQAVGTALFNRRPPAEDVHLAQEAIDGIDPTGGALYFYNPARTAIRSWIRRLPILVRFGEIDFAR